jgi:hypothetical protein
MTAPWTPAVESARLSAHEEQSIDAIADFHHEHYRSASALR